MLRAGLMVAAVVGVCGVAAGGDLQPPPGAVAPTMKTLDQVEAWQVIDPRTAVGSPDSVVLISQPGRYRLVGDIIGQPGMHGIRITADDVTIDTNGFSLIGVPGSLDGINSDNTTKSNIGPVRWMAPESIRGWGGSGISLVNAENVRVQNLGIAGCGGNGLDITFGTGVSQTDIENVEIRGCTLRGIKINSGIGGIPVVHTSNSRISQCGSDGILIENAESVSLSAVEISDCGGDGMNVAGSGIGVFKAKHGSVLNCVGDGIDITEIAGVSLEDIDIGGCGGDGVRAIVSPGVLKTYFETGDVPTQDVAGDGIHVEGYLICECDHLIAADTGGDGLEIIGAEAVRVSNMRVRNSGGWGLDIAGGPTARANVEVEKFHVKQEFGPTQGGVRARVGGAGGGGRIAIRAGSISDTGLGGVVCEGYETAVLGALNIGSSGMDGVSMRPDGGGGGGAVAASSTRMDDIDVFGSVGDNVNFNPLATGGTHDIAVSGGHISGAGGNGLSVVPSTAGTYVFQLQVKDTTSSANGGHGMVFEPAQGVTTTGSVALYERCETNGNGGDGQRNVFRQDFGPVQTNKRECSSTGNTGNGHHDENTSCWIRVSQASGNGGHGFYGYADPGGTRKGYDVYQSKSDNNAAGGIVGDGVDPVLMQCVARGNTTEGVFLFNCQGSSITGCVAGNNGGSGIRCGTTCTGGSVVDCRGDGNTGAGVLVEGSGMFVARCSATVGPAGGVVVAPGNNLVGPAVDVGNIATEGSSNANMNR